MSEWKDGYIAATCRNLMVLIHPTKPSIYFVNGLEADAVTFNKAAAAQAAEIRKEWGQDA